MFGLRIERVNVSASVGGERWVLIRRCSPFGTGSMCLTASRLWSKAERVWA